MKVKTRRIKKQPLIKLLIVFLLIFMIIFGIRQIIYHNTDEYKLKQIGYNKEQITKILKLDKDKKEKVLKIDYNEFLLKLFEEKYYISANTDRYLEYEKQHKGMSASDIVAVVNVNGDYEHYTNTNPTNLDDGLLILVNKYNYLSSDYNPDDLEEVRNWYCYGENEIRSEVYDNFIDMFYDAKEEGLTLIITSGYRDYKLQKELYEEYQIDYGEEGADKVAARAGFSEHHTGLALDIVTYDVIMEEFEKTDEFKWMQENAYKYGFILRYPKDKEYITGYSYESWHYRYVGKETAKTIHDLGITFDEYYAYYVKQN